MTQPGKPPLDGIRVLDLTTVVFGPYCTQTLADLGADVIKVESPDSGDAFRWSGVPAKTPGMSPGFMAFNRGKRSLALDLKAPEDNARMRALVAKADLFVVNVRGKALERLGLDYEAVRAINPGIVYVHCVGFGQDGPYADLQAYDDVIQAATGTATLLPRVDGDARPRYLPSLIADKVAGLHAAYAAMAALYQRERTGAGQRVEVPMFEAFSHFMLAEHLAGQSFDPPMGPAGYARQLDPDRQPFPTSDGHISIVAYTSEAWDTIFALVETPAFMDDPRFATARDRWAHSALLYQELARQTVRFTTDELLRRCAAAQIPAQPVRDIGAMIDDPHLAATGFFRRRDHPSEGTWIDMAPPVRFGAAPLPDTAPPPLLGECDGAAWAD
ncbi:crotonobetainyl-CoA:carnitine CoA-transferase CaiB-like acyl-CoA transferase [Novosphingobium kunmingense]|uniref:Crotonobetainyl-CoA:carnitine CoA-transferase CaiB-like acyl-CoA transferase n=1 Tax=Novosphingobium kunmingense TaxID=1211806 RepID=A0A2N0H6D5_9SPHN|nr:CoA transferase [Novosphingobium kunmingense]PKB14511.1 crotonobetainyl-CoA:carnitine CoA-transferase CaiB-like acyl-CoA transferase [Novosphingobium kunmingense]